MNEYTLLDGLARLEAISAEFDYDKSLQYVFLVKEYLKEVSEFDCDTPIFDVCEALDVELPQDAGDRLEVFFNRKSSYSPTVKNICQWHLLEIHAMDLGLIANSPSIYESLIQMLELGGDFYEHHGALCIRDAAMLPFAK